jgi:hypothetical protein
MWSEQGSEQSALHEAAQQALTYINQHKHQADREILDHLVSNNRTGFIDLLLSTFVPSYEYDIASESSAENDAHKKENKLLLWLN